VPGFVADAAKLKAKGVDEIVIVSVNDPFVMAAWGDVMGGDLTYLADTQCELTEKLGLVLDATAKLGNKRSVRYALVAKNGIVSKLFVEEGGQMEKSKSSDVLAAL